MKEQVLVVPAKYLEPHLSRFKNGLVTDDCWINGIRWSIMSSDIATYIGRDIAETDESFKQLIPYCILMQEGRIFAYQRTKKGGESRLHDKWSIGVGGHINPCDESGYRAAIQRELLEEVGIDIGNYEPPIKAFIYDDSNEVGRVHLGIVHLISISRYKTLTFKDPSLANGIWMSPEELQSHSYENWSQLLVDHFWKGDNS
jgi:predicted NUDIX family phosphoesterase